MRAVAPLAITIFLMAAPTAQAEHGFRFAQFDEGGQQVERATWRCGDVEVRANRCTQGVLLVIDGRPQPVEIASSTGAECFK